MFKTLRMLTEAFSALEAIPNSYLDEFKVKEPSYGPALMAKHEGSASHKDTIIVVGIIEDPEDEDLPLAVMMKSDWDGIIHEKFFNDTKDGYKAALDYANILRTANLTRGGKPKGWKD